MIRHLFAYGTLQHGHAPAGMKAAVARLKPVGRGAVRGVRFDLEDFPGAVLDLDSSERNARTVFDLPEDDQFLAQLDLCGEFDRNLPKASQFVRQPCWVEMEGGGRVECWIYVYDRGTAGMRVVTGGWWKADRCESCSTLPARGAASVGGHTGFWNNSIVALSGRWSGLGG